MGIDFELVNNPISEDVKAGENPLDYVVRMSKEKAKAGLEKKASRLARTPLCPG